MSAQSTRPAPRQVTDVPTNGNRFMAVNPSEETGRFGNHAEQVAASRGHPLRLDALVGPRFEEEQTCP